MDATIDEKSIAAFCEATRVQGEDFFGESADNLTGILIDLSHFIKGFRLNTYEDSPTKGREVFSDRLLST